ncbi:nitric oxide reductase activation protein NorD [Piscinibacter koreensis]|uniref:VWA domain-containing protein n=1 Tax=Piscinibacter koreensis TaxID=2742824 RepID=A0A7Y6NN64_9BURK|nr:VWA domain-containing protein [Schlegelella koreensis]NUZ06271.1 VWA domain-containing protein [Schlegelella koreensis]
MGAGAAGEPVRLALERYLPLLWSPAPRLRFDAAPTPFMVGATLHLPPAPPCDGAQAWAWYRAAAAHGAAHRTYSPPHFDAQGLRPIARAVLGLLEDARVEALACHELPGLRALWARWHVATPDDGDGFETLLLRLARRLIGGPPDPHPWVEKGRRLLFGDAGGASLPVLRVEDLRAAATRLGNDIGQMRLGFNPRLYVPGPSYRDDHRWMWPSGADPAPTAVAEDTEPAATRKPSQPAGEATVEASSAEHRYPEWDRAIGRHRAAWCSVREVDADHAGSPTADAAAESGEPDTSALEAALRRALRHGWAAPARNRQSAADGDHLDLDALIRTAIARRTGGALDARIYRQPQRRPRHGRAVMLIDRSRSSAEPWAATTLTRLAAAGTIAALLARQLPSVGIDCAIVGFSSNGRHDVRLQFVKDFGAPVDADAIAALRRLRSSGSTRVGAVIRHAAARLAGCGAAQRGDIVLITDGEPHDIDVHDSRYLPEDARQAVLQARRRGIRVSCLVLDRSTAALVRGMVGAPRTAVLGALEDLPSGVRRLAAA